MAINEVSDEWLKASWLMGVLAGKMDEALGVRGAFIEEVRHLNEDLNARGGVNMQALDLMRDVGRERGLTEEQMALSADDVVIAESPVFLGLLRAIHAAGQRNPRLVEMLHKLNDEKAKAGGRSVQ